VAPNLGGRAGRIIGRGIVHQPCVQVGWPETLLNQFLPMDQDDGMVLTERDSLNSLFDTLQEWERHLAQLDHDGLRCGDDQFKPKL